MKISVIIPVYNAENYIGRCIESVLAQTYDEWELIAIDDGSTDKSLLILEHFSKLDSRIKVLHQNNAGPGAARNAGMSIANGEYFVFIDSDDVVKKEYLERISNETADVIFIDVSQVDGNLKPIKKEYLSIYESYSKDKFIRSQMTGKILWGGVRKAVRAELVKKNNIGFTKHKIGEEAVYSFLLMYYAKSFVFLKGEVYKYVNREGSQSHAIDEDPWGGVVTTLKNTLIEMGIYEQYANTINAFIVTATVVALNNMASIYKKSEFDIWAKKRIKKCFDEIDLDYSIDTKNMPLKARAMFPLVRKELINMIYVLCVLKKLID